ncbi:MAG TPA: glutathione S-transferase N-terminal domain-containing protein [Beijerinckiaceae bacterium]|jgi:glutathione S-transferase
MADAPRLYVLAPSHYCERARWALDAVGLSYVEERWAVGLHVPRARRLAPSSALPILTVSQKVVQGSGAILDWTGMPGGAPGLEQRFEDVIGVLVRQFIYAATLHVPTSGVREALFDGVPARQARLGRLFWPVTRQLMRTGMKARPKLLPEVERRLAAELDWFEGELAGREHLVGDGFGRADLTAASLLAPLARPAACPLYQQVRLPDAVEETVARWRARPGLQWVNRIYADHRRASLPVARHGLDEPRSAAHP